MPKRSTPQEPDAKPALAAPKGWQARGCEAVGARRGTRAFERGAGEEAPARRAPRRQSRLGGPRAARPRLRLPHDGDGAAPPRPDRRPHRPCARTPAARQGGNGAEPPAPRRCPAPLPQGPGPRRRGRDGRARRGDELGAASKASSTRCCAGSGPRARRSSRPRTPRASTRRTGSGRAGAGPMARRWRAASPRPSRGAARSTSRSRPTRKAGPPTLGAELLPTGSSAPADGRRRESAAWLRRGRLVGAGRGRGTAGTPARRCRGKTRPRSLRGTRRQDGAAGAGRRRGDRASIAPPHRLRRLAENLARLRLECASSSPPTPQLWRPEEPADAVLLDAPCSATGTDPAPSRPALLKRPPMSPRWRRCRTACSTLRWPWSARAAFSSMPSARSSRRRGRRASPPCWPRARPRQAASARGERGQRAQGARDSRGRSAHAALPSRRAGRDRRLLRLPTRAPLALSSKVFTTEVTESRATRRQLLSRWSQRRRWVGRKEFTSPPRPPRTPASSALKTCLSSPWPP